MPRSAKKAILFKVLRYSGLPFVFRELVQRSKVTILLFHDMPKEKAKATLDYLRRHYNVIGLTTFIEKCRSNGKHLPPKSLILTLDDGHIRNWELLPLVKEMKTPITIFLCAGMVGTNRHFWCRKCGPHYSMPQLRDMPNAERLRLLQSIGFTQDREYEEPQALTRKQIEEMKPYFDFQAHTLFHPSLPRCSDDEARDEIGRCKSVLENDLGLRINAISYPHGDYCDRDVELCQQAGYSCGVTADCGFNTAQTDLFRLKRICISDTDGIDELAVKASGLWGIIQSLINGARTRRAENGREAQASHVPNEPRAVSGHA